MFMGIVGLIRIVPQPPHMYGCLYKWMEQKYPSTNIGRHGTWEAKTGGRSLNKGKKLYGSMEVQSKTCWR